MDMVICSCLKKSANAESLLQLIFQEAVIGFSHLAQAAKEGKEKSIHEHWHHHQLEYHGDLAVGQEILLCQLFEVANKKHG